MGLPRKLAEAVYVPGAEYVKSAVNAPPICVSTVVVEFAESLRPAQQLRMSAQLCGCLVL